MTDDQHGEGTPRSGGRWDPLPQGDYDDGATAFVKLPEGGIEALLAGDTPLAAPGHGYVPPQITVAPPADGADTWATPAGGTEWPAQTGPQTVGDDRFTYHPGATGQWNFDDPASDASAPGHDVTGQWSIPVAGGDLPDESGEFTTSSLVEQWGGTPPATLPGGAPAPWASGATDGAGRSWAQQAEASAPAGVQETGHHAPGAPAFGDAPEYGGAHDPGHDVAHRGDHGLDHGGDHGTGQRSGHGPAHSGEHGGEHGGEHTAAYADAPLDAAAHAPAAHTRDAGAPAPGGTTSLEASRPVSAPAGPPGASGDTEAVHEAAEGAQGRAEAPAGTEAESAAPDGDPSGHARVDAPEEGGPEQPDAAAPDELPAPPAEEHPLASYVLRVNSSDRPVTDAWIGESLLYVLRERLGLAGAKDGCSQGECGACNVQVDGRLVASCLVPAVTTAGSEIRTVEGLATDGQPSDVQRALARCGAVQCGFCVPGMAMTVHDLLEGNPAPTERETRQALCGNLCRCSGYRGVLRAVKSVVAEREANAAAEAESDGDEARIPHQAGPGAGGVHASAFENPAQPHPHDQAYGQAQDGGQA
ncbi:2Fe-2S iron-sulfur cluster-binding protein [Streptomyces phaeofaciens]|uniref:2Fe-2S iron-sulfur cluster-binding protein n=1 Tax=Streptomyces phaeofaciens TaxID=68254 RepID=UPI00369CEB81